MVRAVVGEHERDVDGAVVGLERKVEGLACARALVFYSVRAGGLLEEEAVRARWIRFLAADQYIRRQTDGDGDLHGSRPSSKRPWWRRGGGVSAGCVGCCLRAGRSGRGGAGVAGRGRGGL